MDLDIFELMKFFDNFEEADDAITFFSNRNTESVELIIKQRTNLAELHLRSDKMRLHSLFFKFYNYIHIQSSVLTIVSNYSDSLKYMHCQLTVDENIKIFVQPSF